METVLYIVSLLEDEVKTYDCQLCDKSFLESKEIETHIKDHQIKILKESATQ